MARYRKIDPRLWKDEKFQQLTSEEKLIAVYLVTAQSNRIGLFNFSPAMAIEDLGVLPETFREAFDKVCQTLNWAWDKHARVLFLPTWWKYNTPENPNVLVSALNDLHEIPETHLIQRFWSNDEYLPESFQKAFRKLRQRVPKASGKVSPQEQEQEQEQEQNTNRQQNGDGASVRPLTQVQQVVLGWKALNGVDLKDTAWDKEHFARNSKPAKSLINLFGDVGTALDCMEYVYGDLKSKKLDCTLETIVKHSDKFREVLAKRSGGP